jgi:hypothetical protein
MEKTLIKIAIIFAVVTLGFYSCTPDPIETESNPPVITVTSPVADTINVFVGDSIEFEVALSSENSLKSLLVLSSSGSVVLKNYDQEFTNSTSETVTVTAIVTETAEDNEIADIVFTVNDAQKSANTRKVIVAKVKETPLSEPADFEWKRVGGTPGTGLEMFGLTWTMNKSTMVNAVIKKNADKFVELDSEKWTSISNLEALKEAIDAATDIAEWTKVSAGASNTYDLCLGTISEGNYYLIHINKSTVTVGDVGTTITIFGQYKK